MVLIIILGSVLRGKKAFTVNNKLFCKDCHAVSLTILYSHMPHLHYAFVYTQRQERSLGHAVDGTSQQQIQYVSACHQLLLTACYSTNLMQMKPSRDFQIPPAATASRQMTSV